MPKESLGYVRLDWTCSNCGTRNPGPQTKCAGCGAPQPADVTFTQAAQEQLLTDQAEAARAAAGADVHCPYCGARNPAGLKACPQCGGDLTGGQARASGAVLGAHRIAPAAPMTCPACGTANPGNALRCAQCGATLPGAAAPQPQAPAAAPARRSAGLFAILGVAVCLIMAVVAFFALRTTEVTGEVRTTSWQRSIGIEALVPVEYQGWRDEVPAGASVGRCERRQHHTQQEPAANSEKVCGTPYTVDRGNGYGEVVQDCEYRVYADWCTYTVPEWREVDRVEAEGSDLSPRWPEARLSSGQREGDREEVYKVTFLANDRSYTLTTGDLGQFQQCTIGSRWKLTVRGTSVVELSPE